MIVNDAVRHIYRNQVCHYSVMLFVTPILIAIGLFQIHNFIRLSKFAVRFNTGHKSYPCHGQPH